ncbi:hypothetical protein LGT41_0008405 [Abyssibius alkaniclasticus]|uniref:hypothetical protein n=1 Tax=Abyssibius alkaniclasticus TaxID=2881234 RepID=UPI0023633165|nr:hypothetical protein [Abyssibius alkaniclasticus]UPH69847.1 hypothetical protein LGT41_0008405 [Abyssibius alkaniclasticus]|tara:strand:+ start:600 stop:794 length:195 start_codon:yes stop_codon:yes gene_type:complete
MTDPAQCQCKSARGDPRRQTGLFVLLRDTRFAGHSEMLVQCTNCGARYQVSEDIGYHVPQYHWR